MLNCYICNFNTDNENLFNKHFKSQIHFNNFNNLYTLYYYNNDELLKEINVIGKKKLNDIIFDSNIFNNNFNKIKINYQNNNLFYLIKEDQNKLIPYNNINYIQNVINITNYLYPIKDFLKLKMININQEESFTKGFILSGGLYIIYILFSSSFNIILFSFLGGLSFKYLRTKM